MAEPEEPTVDLKTSTARKLDEFIFCVCAEASSQSLARAESRLRKLASEAVTGVSDRVSMLEGRTDGHETRLGEVERIDKAHLSTRISDLAEEVYDQTARLKTVDECTSELSRRLDVHARRLEALEAGHAMTAVLAGAPRESELASDLDAVRAHRVDMLDSRVSFLSSQVSAILSTTCNHEKELVETHAAVAGLDGRVQEIETKLPLYEHDHSELQTRIRNELTNISMDPAEMVKSYLEEISQSATKELHALKRRVEELEAEARSAKRPRTTPDELD